MILVTVTGVKETLSVISADLGGRVVAGTAAMVAGAELIKSRAKANVAPYRYSGRLEEGITVKGPTIIKGVTFVTVGLHGVFAPEGKTFEAGWKSSRGLAPPSQAFVAWAESKGFADPKRAAFVIARNIASRPGYSFGERHWLSSAFVELGPVARGLIEKATSESGFGQPRDAGGRFMSWSA